MALFFEFAAERCVDFIHYKMGKNIGNKFKEVYLYYDLKYFVKRQHVQDFGTVLDKDTLHHYIFQ